jgi:hypothetical protein
MFSKEQESNHNQCLARTTFVPLRKNTMFLPALLARKSYPVTVPSDFRPKETMDRLEAELKSVGIDRVRPN